MGVLKISLKELAIAGIICGLLMLVVDLVLGGSFDLIKALLYPIVGILLYYFYITFKLPYAGFMSGLAYGVVMFFFGALVPSVSAGVFALQALIMTLVRDLIVGVLIWLVNSNISTVMKKI